MRYDRVNVLLPSLHIYMPYQKSEMFHKYHPEKFYNILIFDSATTVFDDEDSSFWHSLDYLSINSGLKF